MAISYLKTDLPGEKLIKSLYYVINSVRIHHDNNQVVKDGVSQLRASIVEFSQGDDVPIQIWRGRFHILGEKLVYRRDTINIINEMLEYFSRRNLGGMCFLPSTKDAPHESMVDLVRLLNECVKRDDAPGWLDMQLERSRLGWVEIFKKPDESEDDTGQSSSDDQGMSSEEKAQRAYFYALEILRSAAGGSSGLMGGIRKARRLAQTIVDLAQEDSSLLLGLATAKDYENYTYIHSVNVAFISACLGRRTGLSRVALEHLAVCALYHDLGRLSGSEEHLFKQGDTREDPWDRIKNHSLVSVKEILKLGTPKSLRIKIVPGTFEHHLNCDLSGNPGTHFVKSLSLFGKILRIADVYETLTSERGSSSMSFTPDEALRQMWSERGKSFDTLLMKRFIHMMGIYPIGTIVELNTGEKGIVMDYLSDADKSLPYVMILKEDGMDGFTPGEKIDLSSPDAGEEGPARSIQRTIHFSELGIQPAEFFRQSAGKAFDFASV
jgi:HD-GYP domain-containing protein (c-di-GMP phosphodiesterase class II)